MIRQRTINQLSAAMIGLGILTVASGWTGPAVSQTRQQQTAARVFSDVGLDQKLDSRIPLDLTFRDEEGKPVRLGDYFHGRPVVLSLVYYQCPMLCTEVLNGMVESFLDLNFTVGKEFDVVTVSFDPSETPDLAAAKKAEYLRAYGHDGAENGWHFLTGDEPSIAKLTAAVGFHYVYDPDSRQFAHPSGIMVLTPSGVLARYFYGIEYEPKDLRFALIEAAKGNIGTPVDKLLLLCYHYDPSKGKYGLVIMNIFRAAGALTVLLVGGFLVVMFRRERRQRAETVRT